MRGGLTPRKNRPLFASCQNIAELVLRACQCGNCVRYSAFGGELGAGGHVSELEAD